MVCVSDGQHIRSGGGVHGARPTGGGHRNRAGETGEEALARVCLEYLVKLDPIRVWQFLFRSYQAPSPADLPQVNLCRDDDGGTGQREMV